MEIRHVRITVPDAAEVMRYFRDGMGQAASETDDGFEIVIGATTLVLREGGVDDDRHIHLAFDVPENAIDQVAAWASAFAKLHEKDGRQVHTASPSWNADSLYFYGPGRLNLEFIARHRAATAIDRPFTPRDLVSISEVGVPTHDPLKTLQQLTEVLGLRPFGQPSDQFAPIGDDRGLLILVHEDRLWWPTSTEKPRGADLIRGVTPLAGTIHVGGTRIEGVTHGEIAG